MNADDGETTLLAQFTPDDPAHIPRPTPVTPPAFPAFPVLFFFLFPSLSLFLSSLLCGGVAVAAGKSAGRARG